MKRHFLRAAILLPIVLATTLPAGCTGRTSPVQPAGLQQQEADPAAIAQLRSELERVLATRGIELDAEGRPLRSVSSIPKRSYFMPSRIDDLLSESALLSWTFQQTGDYDLNGEVNISDLTPLGIHLGKDSSSPDWVVAQVADGDGNGEVNVADVTPIGQNFGIQVYGFVIEARDFPNAPWQEFGFDPYTEGQLLGSQLVYGYEAPGGSYLPEFRAAPVGAPRNFNWSVYQLTDSAQDFQNAELCVLDGQPALAFTAFRDSFGSRLGYAAASIQYPAGAGDWDVEYGVALDYYGSRPPALAAVAHEPAIAYLSGSGAPMDVRYLRRESLSGNWTSHIVTTFTGIPDALDMTTRQGLPLVMADDNGLVRFNSTVAVPSSGFDWGIIAASPGLTRFINMEVVCSGPWQFAIGLTGAAAENLAFNRSKSANPVFQSDFSEFQVGLGSSSGDYPSLVLNQGIPAIAAFDNSTAASVLLSAASREDDDALGWQSHVVAGGGNVHTLSENPEICLIDGRPAIVSGFDPMGIYWAAVPQPGQGPDWHVQQIASVAPHSTHSMVSLEGRPLIALQIFSDALGSNQVAIAVAQEQ